MGADDKLYELLAGDREIPWAYAAEEFLNIKVASGGLYPDDAQEVCKIVIAAARISDEQKEKAVQQGLLTGMRGLVSGDVGLVGRGERTRGSRTGKAFGTVGGAGLGLLAARKSTRGGRALAAALGALGGRTVGEAVGTEVDVAKAKSRLSPKSKKAEIVKEAEEKKEITPLKAALLGAPAGALAGLAVGATAPGRHARKLKAHISALKAILKKKGLRGLSDLQKMQVLDSTKRGYTARAFELKHGTPTSHAIGTTAIGTAAGGGGGALLARGVEHLKERKQGIERVKIGPKERAALVAKHGPEVLGDLGLKKHSSAVQRVFGIMAKLAQRPGGDSTITTPTVPLPAESPLTTQQPAELHPAIQAQLDQMQQVNEAEFYRQEAEKAKGEAEAGKQRVEELIQQINMLNQQAQSQMAQDQQIRQVAEQNAQMAQQDSMQARDESMQAQQQNMALRAAVTQFRQALMNLVAQDPTQAMGPPPVQTAPLPAAPGAAPEAGAPAGAPPAAPEGAQPGAAPPPAAPAGPAVPPPPEPAAPPAVEPMAPPPPAGGVAPAPAAG